jgi:ribonuclease P protein component
MQLFFMLHICFALHTFVVIIMEQTNIKYPKKEKLKSKIVIGELFTTGKTVSKYPLRMVYVPITNNDNIPLKTGVSVSKRYFKKAVDRNYYKRLLREAYRLNKHILLEGIDQQYAIMLFYQSKDQLSFQEVNQKMIKLFEKFNAATQPKPTTTEE